MHHYLSILFTLVMITNYFEYSQATDYCYKSNAKEDYKLLATSHMKNSENTHSTHHSKWIFHNTSKNLSIEETPMNYRPHTKKQSIYSPLKYTIVDSNDVDVVYNKRGEQLFDPSNNSQQQRLENVYNVKKRENPLLLKQLQSQKQELSAGYADFIHNTNQFEIAPKETTVNSNDHYKTRHFAAYVTPSPSHLKMHPNLHHIKQHVDFEKKAIVSYATGSEPSPMTTTSINSLTSMENVQQFLTRHNDLKYIVNKKFNKDAEVFSEFNKHLYKEGSKQHHYAPIRPSLEKELPYSSNTLPYPPSFIYITTTTKPLLKYESVYHTIPDLFTHRQFKSLWDSYIPSWYITNTLQQLKTKADLKNKNNNLQTLAFTKEYKL